MIGGGPFRESNPGPPAPEAGIIPLDQTDNLFRYYFADKLKYDKQLFIQTRH